MKDQLLKTHAKDSGFDLVALNTKSVKPGTVTSVSHGVKIKMHTPWWLKILGMEVEAQIRPKSSRNLQGLLALFGTVDNEYRGELISVVANLTDKPIKIQEGEKVSQIVFAAVFTCVKKMRGQINADTARGTGGFGSTGLK